MTQRWGFLAAFLVIVLVLASPNPSGAIICDLTTAGSSCSPTPSPATNPTNINGALFFQADPQPTGTGVIDSFVRTDTPGGQVTPSEQGYNTSVRPLPQSGSGEVNQYTNTSPQFTRDLPIGSVGTEVIGGVTYRKFLLDINESNSNAVDALLTLDQLKIFVSGSALTAPNYNGTTLSGLSPIYNLDAGGDNWVNLNYNLNHGSGSGDMFLFVRNDLFTGASFVYLYSQFGCPATGGSNFCGTKYAASDGYEEWAVTGATPIPEPGTISLLGIGLVGTGLMWSRRRQS